MTTLTKLTLRARLLACKTVPDLDSCYADYSREEIIAVVANLPVKDRERLKKLGKERKERAKLDAEIKNYLECCLNIDELDMLYEMYSADDLRRVSRTLDIVHRDRLKRLIYERNNRVKGEINETDFPHKIGDRVWTADGYDWTVYGMNGTSGMYLLDNPEANRYSSYHFTEVFKDKPAENKSNPNWCEKTSDSPYNWGRKC